MNWLLFFQLWFLIGLSAALFRPKMIWQESSKPYRLFLVLACLPTGITIILASHILGAFRTWGIGQIRSIRGLDPTQAEAQDL